MFKSGLVGLFILYLNIFDYIGAPSNHIQILTNRSPKAKINELRKITPREVLPMISIMNKKTFTLSTPEDLKTVSMVDGRIAFGTQFTSSDPHDKQQIFLCPNENSNEKCVEPKTFQKQEPLQCGTEIVPVLKMTFQVPTCGPDAKGTLVTVINEICKAQMPYKFNTEEVVHYKFCFDSKKRKTLFTSHNIRSPKLLTSNLLFREREVNYEMLNDDEIIGSNYTILKSTLEKEASLQLETQKDTPPEPTTDPETFPYKVQMLVPPDDMAFATWRKSAFHFLNAELQHEKLITLWNKINRYVTTAISEMPVKERKFTSIYTSVSDIPEESDSAPGGQNQVYNVWIKLIYNEKKHHGAIIVMNNFISTNDPGSSVSPSPMEKAMDKYCSPIVNLCVSHLKKEFEMIGGVVRCCEVNKESEEFFGIKKSSNKVLLLPIKNINMY
ncbi:uncharacterized protein LOC135833705 [Planococcus citri]|uniref:uncharacterized protein LOC135833705 n=1 Tax=Planococcus citri TaxID=170843 RepID=UPI0031F9A7DD